ncbi:MAG: SurA N-terminal domain-containing protein [Bacteroidales bacterium]|nr:SurA N-terminal domain-containing protein [Bacteroidales bacterium]MDD2322748.1 SurA N-terminal domain-containing protein [Bacteroidales bacterium]MDD3009907.1 SurA N-terminal domain-containing protein [Bacteroidales bacterium]MDD3960395.1 SurA N-terminal domain-containing protein [Bacteroidales bacterium]MDY0285481.1 SurA N-terminal domain-containing protein [Bacteroidales bacterium]
MAVIGKIRQRSALLIIVIGVALAAFILGDFFKRGQRRDINIGVIAGEKISVIDFNRKVDGLVEMRERSSGERLNADDLFNIKQSTWTEMVQEIIMDEQFGTLGIGVTVQELNDLIRGDEPHPYIKQNFSNPQTGEFDPQQVSVFLENLNNPNVISPDMRQNYLYLESLIKKDRMQRKYFSLLSQGYYIPTVFAKKDYQDKNQKALYRLVAATYKSIEDSEIEVTDADFKAYYDKNKYRYTQEPSRDLEYVIFPVNATEEDYQALEKNINGLFEEFREAEAIPNFVNAVSDLRYDSTWYKPEQLPLPITSRLERIEAGAFVEPFFEDNTFHFAKIMEVANRPDSMKASHILITYNGAFRADPQITRKKEEAKALADSLLLVLNTRPSKLAELAAEFSDDPSAEENEGDLGWFMDGTMVFPFNHFVFSNPKGSIGIAETVFGYHIIRVEEKARPEEKVRYAHVARNLEPSDRTFQDIFLEASEFATKNADNASFNAAIAEKGLDKRTSERITNMVNRIPGLDFSRGIVQWAFLESTSAGDVSQVYSFDDKFVVASLKEIHEEEYQPLEDIKENIRPLVIREKKTDMLLQKVESALATTNDLNALASQLGVTVETVEEGVFNSPNIPNYGREPEVVGTVFSLNPGETSGAIKGEQAIYVVSLDSFQEAGLKNDFSREATAMANQFRTRINREAPKAIENASQIEDNRYLYY